MLPDRRFLLGGSGWADKLVPAQRRRSSAMCRPRRTTRSTPAPLAVLNISRDSMAATGFSPATRVFEAAGAGACLITDAWEGIELFLDAGRGGAGRARWRGVAEALRALTPARAGEIGAGRAAARAGANTPTRSARRRESAADRAR